MNPQVIVREQATNDALEIAAYIAADSTDLAHRFLSAVQECYGKLAENPQIGPSVGRRHPKLRKLRKWPVQGFLKYIIFYEVIADGIEIVAVLHGARRIYRVLREER